MKKKFILLITALSLLTTAVPTFASTTPDINETSKAITLSEASKPIDKETFLKSDVAKAFHVQELKTIPKDAKVLKFNTWNEALNFLKTTQADLDSKYTKNKHSSLAKSGSLYSSDNPGDELGTDYYSVGYVNFSESGSGTVPKKVDWDCPNATYQTVHSEHYFDYSDGSVTNSSRGSYISGVGISTWSEYYSGLTHPDDYEWHSIIKGKWGYYVSVGGQNIGASYTVGLMAICTPS